MIKGPSERAQQVLASYKASQKLAEPAKARLLDVVQERALRGDLPRFDVQPTTPFVPEPSVLQQIWASPLAKVGLGLMIAGPAALGAYRGLGNADSEPRAPVIALAPPEQTPAPAASTSNEASGSTGDQPPFPATSASPRARSERPTAASASASEATIDEEVRLMNEAQAALRAGDPQRALERLNEHAARFPSGKLSSARAVTHMMALCQSGREAQARLEASRFLARYPNSPFTDRVKTICSPRGSP